MGKLNKKCSFDFDDTLDRHDVQVFASSLVDKGYDVWIVTSRYNTEGALINGWPWIEAQNEELFKVADYVGIKRDNIVFTDHEDKINYLAGKGFIFHLDDSADELMRIYESDDTCFPMNIDWMHWQEDLIEKFEL